MTHSCHAPITTHQVIKFCEIEFSVKLRVLIKRHILSINSSQSSLKNNFYYHKKFYYNIIPPPAKGIFLTKGIGTVYFSY